MDSHSINQLMSGALIAGYLVASLFFLRFWTKTRDRLFAMFAAAFGVLAIQRLGISLSTEVSEDLTLHYIARLIAFILILVAIIDKNRARHT